MSLIADLRGVEGVVFDLDDTLCGYWSAARAGLNRAFATHPVEGFNVEAMVKHWSEAFRGLSSDLKSGGWYERYCESGETTRAELMRRALALMGVHNEDHALRLSQTYAEQRNAHLQLFEESREVLDALKGHVTLALLTNGPADVQRQEIETLGIETYFNDVFIEGEMRVGKPDREAFRQVEHALQLAGPQLLMVGNSFSADIRGALDSGWRAIWVRRESDVAPSARGPEVRPETGPFPEREISSLRALIQA